MPRRAFISLVIKVSGNVNADMGVGTRIPLKKIYTWNQEVKAFVSARCLRRCIRERLFEKGEQIDPLTMVGREEQLGDLGDPVKYVDDDLFGYLCPGPPARRRHAPVKVSHLISLKHTEIKPEFAGRFPREFLPGAQKGFPVPFEVEVAEWLGKVDVIVSDRVGCFEADEITDEHKRSLAEKGGKYYMSVDARRERLRKLLEVILWEGWQFPRSAQSPSVPDFHYAVIALTERFTPIFGYVDVTDGGKLSEELLGQIASLYGEMIDEMFVLKYKEGSMSWFKKSGESPQLKVIHNGKLDAQSLDNVLKEITSYIVHEEN